MSVVTVTDEGAAGVPGASSSRDRSRGRGWVEGHLYRFAWGWDS